MADYDLHYVDFAGEKIGWYAEPEAYKGLTSKLGIKKSKTSVKGVKTNGRVNLPRIRITTNKGKSYLRYVNPANIDDVMKGSLLGVKLRSSAVTQVSFVR